MKRPRLGLALGSGSARGWAHIGVIQARLENGFEPDIVCGTSIGSLVGAVYVAGRLDDLRRWAEAATWREIVGMLDVRLASGGLIEGELIVDFLREFGLDQAIEDCGKRYAAVATDLETGYEIWLRSGPIEQAVRASIALPGIISPVQIGEQWLIDGGLCNPVPVSVCRALGAEIIIAVNLNGDMLGRRFEQKARQQATSPRRAPRELVERVMKQLPPGLKANAARLVPPLIEKGPSKPGYFDVLMNSLNIMQDHITRMRLGGEPPHVMVCPRVHDIRLLEFHRAEEAIAEGRNSIEQALPTIRRLV